MGPRDTSPVVCSADIASEVQPSLPCRGTSCLEQKSDHDTAGLPWSSPPPCSEGVRPEMGKKGQGRDLGQGPVGQDPAYRGLSCPPSLPSPPAHPSALSPGWNILAPIEKPPQTAAAAVAKETLPK